MTDLWRKDNIRREHHQRFDETFSKSISFVNANVEERQEEIQFHTSLKIIGIRTARARSYILQSIFKCVIVFLCERINVTGKKHTHCKQTECNIVDCFGFFSLLGVRYLYLVFILVFLFDILWSQSFMRSKIYLCWRKTNASIMIHLKESMNWIDLI